MKKIIAALFTIAVFFLPLRAADAHEPRIVSGEMTTVENPEVSQAFYGELKDSVHTFRIVAKEPFDLYVNVLVPDVNGARKDMSAEIYTGKNLPGMVQEGDGKMQLKREIAILDGRKSEWSKFYEPFAGDNFLKGPEFKSSKDGEALKGVHMDPGTYFVRVSNDDDEGKYVLAIGTKEEFSAGEIANTVKLVPKINTEFFGKSPLLAFWNLIGLFILFFILIFIFVVWTLIKWLKRRKKNKSGENEISEVETFEK
jgi:hypothetical protein